MTYTPGPPLPGDTEDVKRRQVAPDSLDRESLDRSLVQGVAWTSGIKWLVQMLTWAGTLVVMRLLTPADYGLVGMAWLFLGVVSLVSEFGLGSAIIAIRDLSPRQIAQLNSVAVLVGISALAISAAAAEPVSAFFDSPRLPTVVLVLSSTFVISALNVVPGAILHRELRYRTLALVEAGQAVGDVVVTLLLAWLGFGYWSLVIGRITKFLVAAIAYRVISPQRFVTPRINEIRDALTFSSHVLTSRLGWYTYSNADYLIIGKVLGESALGLYTAAFTLSRMPVEKITQMVTRVSPGIFSAVQKDTSALRRYILILTEGLSLVVSAPIIGLGLVAPELIPLMLGDDWVGAVLPLQILSVGAALSAVGPILPQVLQVIHETRFQMRLTLVAAGVFLVGFLAGISWGVVGVAGAWVVLHPTVVLVPTLLKIRDCIGLRISAYASALWPMISSCLVMAAAVLCTRIYLFEETSAPILLSVEVGVGALVYIAMVFTLHRSRVSRLSRAFRLLRE